MKKYVMLIMTFLFIVSGCGQKETSISFELYEQLDDGMTTEDVKNLLGEPIEVEGDIWSYYLQREDTE